MTRPQTPWRYLGETVWLMRTSSPTHNCASAVAALTVCSRCRRALTASAIGPSLFGSGGSAGAFAHRRDDRLAGGRTGQVGVGAGSQGCPPASRRKRVARLEAVRSRGEDVAGGRGVAWWDLHFDTIMRAAQGLRVG
jgi:hypothetical protein